MRQLFFLFLCSSVLLGEEPLHKVAIQKGLLSVPLSFTTLKKSVEDSTNPMSAEKILLGKELFFDKNLSLDRTLSCASCHSFDKGGADAKPTATGYKNRPNPKHLNTPTVLNTAYSKHLFWDGRANSLREQAKGPALASFEMAATPELIFSRIQENATYKKKFQKIYAKEGGVSFENVMKTIAVYEKTLLTRSRYDLFLEGNTTALTSQEQRGLKLFIDMGCKACHFGVAVGGQKMQKFPLREYNSIVDLTTHFDEKTRERHFSKMHFNTEPYHPYPFENRGGFLGKDQKRYFRVPILRNIAQTAPYFHNGSVEKLSDAITIMAKYQLGIDLQKDQLQALEAFLKSLSGELVVYDINETE